MPSFLFRIKRNISIFALAIIFSLAMLFVVKNPDFFQASVLNIQELQNIEKNKRDAAYKTTDNMIDIFVSKDLSWLDYLILTLTYDPSLQLSASWRLSQAAYEIISANSGETQIKLSQFWVLDTNQSLLIIPFSWSSTPLIQEARAVFSNNEVKDLAIGNLSEQNVHGK